VAVGSQVLDETDTGWCMLVLQQLEVVISAKTAHVKAVPFGGSHTAAGSSKVCLHVGPGIC